MANPSIPTVSAPVCPSYSQDIFEIGDAAGVKAALAAMAIAERYMAQEGEQHFSLNLEFFSIWGKVTSFLPPYSENNEQSKVYVSSYRRAKEQALREFVLGEEDISARTESSQNVMLKIWIEQNIPDRDKFLELDSTDMRKLYTKIDLRKDVSWRLLQASHGKFFSLHPELREGMMTEEEWQRQEERKKEERFKAAAPQKPKEIEQAEASASKPAEKDPEEIPKLDTELAEHLTWKVKVFLADKQASSEQFKTARLNALAAGLPVFSTDADKVAALINEDFVIDFKPNLALGQFRALKLNAGVMLEEEKKKAKKAKKAEASVLEKGAGKD